MYRVGGPEIPQTVAFITSEKSRVLKEAAIHLVYVFFSSKETLLSELFCTYLTYISGENLYLKILLHEIFAYFLAEKGLSE
jgi:hypothetical protein